MYWKQPNWTRILTILLVFLASYAILYIGGTLLFRFTQSLLLFVLGAMAAYILSPLVNRLEQAVRLRWAAILSAYVMIAAGLFLLGLLLVTPFVQQAQSLVDNLHNPSPTSLQTIVTVQKDAGRVHRELECVRHASLHFYCRVLGNSRQEFIAAAGIDIEKISRDINDLEKGTLQGPSHTSHPKQPLNGRIPPNPQPQTGVPPSYVQAIRTRATQLQTEFTNATVGTNDIVDDSALKRALTSSKQTTSTASRLLHIMSTTPILLLRSQTWLDQHNLGVDLHSKFGEAANQVSNQGTIILDNSITILSATLNVLLNTTLILIISFYLLNDGRRLIHGGLALVPEKYRDTLWFFISSLDRVVGGYIRGQLLLSSLAGILGGAGAAILGIPYPLLIGIVTFLLETVPVIGPMVALVPAVAISLFFNSLQTTVEIAIWFLVFQQVVTNILGPRIMGMAVGIHPLEALFAVLVGYPLGGFLGAFLAVPIMGVVHILIREAYAYFVLGEAMPSETPPAALDPAESDAVTVGSGRIKVQTKTDSAAG